MDMIEVMRKTDGEIWKHNYQTGTGYVLYKVPLRKGKYQGLKFKDVCMILYQKENIFLIALEVRIAGQIKVFVNPSEYIFDNQNHNGYVIHNQNPTFAQLNDQNLLPSNAENFFIMNYLNKKEGINKRDMLEINQKLAK